MKEKKLETLLYSAVGVAIMFAIIVAVNLIFGVFKTRVDLTEEKLHTLAPGTRKILQKIDSPVEVSFYVTQTRMPSALKPMAQHVEDLLQEFRQASNDKIEIKKFDPQPDTDAEDRARLDGVEPQLMPSGESVYLGVSINQDPVKVALPFLPPDRDKLLEYDLARAISRVLSTNKPVIGVMTPLPIFGMKVPPMMRMQMPQGGQEPWIFLGELKRDFEVKQVEMTAEKIDDDVKVLLAIHPKEIKEATQYAIDQFIMRGGKLVALLDPNCLADAQKQQNMPIAMPGGPSNLDKLLKAWGITFETSKVVADMSFARELRGPNNAPQIMPSYLFVTAAGINKDEVVCSQLDEILMPLAGTFSGTPVSGLKQTPLLKTTKDSELVDTFMAQMNGQKIAQDFKASGNIYNLAIRLEGKFKTAFPDGKPASTDDKDKKDEKKDEAKPADSLKETKSDNSVILIGDSDFVYDHFCAQVQNFFGQKIVIPRFSNLTFIQNLVEQLAGDENLIGSRSRATINRPFTVVKEMQKHANEQFQSKIKKLEADQQEAQQKLNELQAAKKEAGQRFILSPEQQAEIAKFKQKQTDASKELRQVRKDLKREIDSLETRLKWMNIIAVPLAVAVVGLVLASLRKQKTKAK